MGFREYAPPQIIVTVGEMALVRGNDPASRPTYRATGVTFEAGLLKLDTQEQFSRTSGRDERTVEIELYADLNSPAGTITETERVSVPGYGECNVRNVVPYPSANVVHLEVARV